LDYFSSIRHFALAQLGIPDLHFAPVPPSLLHFAFIIIKSPYPSRFPSFGACGAAFGDFGLFETVSG